MSRYDDFEFLDVSVEGSIATVLLNGSEDGNALPPTGHHEFVRIWSELDVDERVDAVVVTGAGEAFCGGPSAALLAAMKDRRFMMGVMESIGELVVQLVDFSKPTVCALNGTPGSGGALMVALLSDILVAERHVVICDGHTSRGIAAGDGGVLAWPVAMGLMRAKRYLLLGDELGAEEAERLGLVTEVVESGASLERAMEYARRLVAGSSTAIRFTKRSLNEWLRVGLPAFRLSWSGVLLTGTLVDHEEAFDLPRGAEPVGDARSMRT